MEELQVSTTLPLIVDVCAGAVNDVSTISSVMILCIAGVLVPQNYFETPCRIG